MPLYSITNSADLTAKQQDALAEAVTQKHTTLFTAPSLFVNVRFTPASHYAAYVGGRKSSSNVIEAHVRTGPSRTTDMYNELCSKIAEAWKEIVPESPDVRIFVLGDIIAGWEHGLPLPAAGKDKEWLRDNLHVFRKRAEAGDSEMQDLMAEVERRKLVDG